MSKCTKCRKKTTICIEFKCKWCEDNFCIGCLAVEAHSCIAQENRKKFALNNLSNILQKNKTKNVKIIKI